jgi:hypothetical protein
MNEEEFWAILKDIPEPKQIFYRLYYNADGSPIIYSMEHLPGNYIEVDQPTYVLAPFNVRVIDGKLVYIKPVVTVKKLQPADWEGNTFTVSNLGMFGIESFTSIINTPESCILSVGAIRQVPVVKNNMVVPGNVMKLTLACDHRTVDGATGAAFLQTLKMFIENPVTILA